MGNNTVFLLWDSSHIWGLMALRGMRCLGLPYRLVKSKQITQGALLGKRDDNQAAILVVPGGNARQKAAALGPDGLRAIREWLRSGGVYLGFCGGAGLALSQDNPAESLGICPWRRASYPERLYHLLSGCLRARLASGMEKSLPVWWPGRFAPQKNSPVRIEAEYIGPAEDLWLADLPFTHIPGHILNSLQNACGLDPQLDFPPAQPLAVSGEYGCGRFFLSYAHLETPDSPEANLWLCQLLQKFCGLPVQNPAISQWQTTPPASGGKTQSCQTTASLPLAVTSAHQGIGNLAYLAEYLGLFFRRTPWLWGWRTGMPGMAVNNLLAACSILQEMVYSEAALALWNEKGQQFCRILNNFLAQAQEFFWSARLKASLAPGAQTDEPKMEHLFGHPMLGGGEAQKILNFLEELIYLSLHNE